MAGREALLNQSRFTVCSPKAYLLAQLGKVAKGKMKVGGGTWWVPKHKGGSPGGEALPGSQHPLFLH